MTDNNCQKRSFANHLATRSAARVRECVSVAVRESLGQPTGRLCPSPVNYEQLVSKNKQSIQYDSHRDLLSFPPDDICHSDVERRIRTIRHSFPHEPDSKIKSLIVRECIKNYRQAYRIVHYKYASYSNSYNHLPRRGDITDGKNGELMEEIFECDQISDSEKKSSSSTLSSIDDLTLKEGWLKVSSEETRTGALPFQKQLKRRYAYLRKEADSTFVLEFHKDEKRSEIKFQIFLDDDFNTTNPPMKSELDKKFAFYVAFEKKDKQVLILADSDAERQDWIANLCKIKQKRYTSNFSAHKFSTLSNDNFINDDDASSSELQRYANESDHMLIMERKKNRHNIFSLYSDLKDIESLVPNNQPNDCIMFSENFGRRFIIKFESFKLRLQATVPNKDGSEESLNPEPYFVTFALFDADRKAKISEDFHVDLNCQLHSKLIRQRDDDLDKEIIITDDKLLKIDLIKKCRTAIFNISKPNPNTFLVGRIDKILSSDGVSGGSSPYSNCWTDKEGNKRLDSIKQTVTRLGKYRQPLAFCVRQLFKPSTTILETNAFFSMHTYKNDSKITDDDLLELLADWKPHNLQQFHYDTFDVSIEEFKIMPKNTLTRSMLPVKDNFSSDYDETALEIFEFPIKDNDSETIASPFTVYVNHLYVYPKFLKYDGQKTFGRARNLTCMVELVEFNKETYTWNSLRSIYAKPNDKHLFKCNAKTAIVHHNQNPDWYDEIKIELPTQLTDQHFLLFSFFHVNCKVPISKQKKDKVDRIENPVGVSILQLFKDGKVANGLIKLPVASILTGHSFTGANDLKWVDHQGKDLFKVKLFLASTVYSADDHITNFFDKCENYDGLKDDDEFINKMKSNYNDDYDDIQIPTSRGSIMIESVHKIHNKTKPVDHNSYFLQALKSLPASESVELVNFFPTISNQLFTLLRTTKSKKVAKEIVNTLTYIIDQIGRANKLNILQSYVQYDFQTTNDKKEMNTIHEPLAFYLGELLLERITTINFPLDTFMLYCNFFFDILIKSMAHYLIYTTRIKMQRSERFSNNFNMSIQHLVQTLTKHIIACVKKGDLNNRKCANYANNHLACFVKRCLSLMDRGLIFRLIKIYIDLLHSEHLNANDAKIINENKLEFLRIVTEHEHYVPLNLPMMQRYVKNHQDVRPDDLQHDYSLSETFCKNHYLVGLLLTELRRSLNDPKEIRRKAIIILRNLLAKHEMDDRYVSPSRKARITLLYLPLISLLIECRNRLSGSINSTQKQETHDFSKISHDKLTKHDSRNSLDTTSTFIVKNASNPKVDSGVLSIISKQPLKSNQESPLTTPKSGSQNSLQDVVDGPISPSFSLPVIKNGPQFELNETKDLLLCFLFVIKYADSEVLLGWLNASTDEDQLGFFNILDICLCHFRYKGKQRINSLYAISDSWQPSSKYNSFGSSSQSSAADFRRKLDSSLFTEVSMIVLDVVCLLMTKSLAIKSKIMSRSTLERSFSFTNQHWKLVNSSIDLHIQLLRYGGETVKKNVFASLRSFTREFSQLLFTGEVELCEKLCYHVLRCCTSRLKSTRLEACTLMYILMRNNFIHMNRSSLSRVYLQTINAEAKLMSEMPGELLHNNHFTHCLSIINSYAELDLKMKQTPFRSEVNKLTKTLREVLKDTVALDQFKNDMEKYADLMYQLAMSYESTPELRFTWLKNLARFHENQDCHSEAAQCYIHSAALIAEYLNRRGGYPKTVKDFRFITKNVEMEAQKTTDDLSGGEGIAYSENTLTQLLEDAANQLASANYLESVIDIYKLILPIYQQHSDYKSMKLAYSRLESVCDAIIDFQENGKELCLACYFKITFYGGIFSDTPERSNFIYREKPFTALGTMIEKMKNLYEDKAREFGGNLIILQEAGKIDETKLNKINSYVQVTSVIQYFDDENSFGATTIRTEFEKHCNINKFMYEIPFTKVNGKSQCDNVYEQYKRRVIVTTSHHFPFVRKRIDIIRTQSTDLKPIDVACDEMRLKIIKLESIIGKKKIDWKMLELHLSGSLNVQVNSGPMAYAEAFLIEKIDETYKLEELKNQYIQFYKVLRKALDIHFRSINDDQMLLHEKLVQNHKIMARRLSEIFTDDSWLDDVNCGSGGSNRNSSCSLQSDANSRRTSNCSTFTMADSPGCSNV